MTKLDKQLINRKIKLILEDLERLREFQDISLTKYQESYPTQLMVERLLEKLIGRLIDCNFHILKTKHTNLPNDYFQSFIFMGQHKEVSTQLAQELAKSAGLRNILAHEYDEIDPDKIHAAIPLVLELVPKYLKQISNQDSN